MLLKGWGEIFERSLIFSTTATFFDIRAFDDWERTFWSFSRNFFKKTRSSFFKVSVRLFSIFTFTKRSFYFLRSIFQFRPYKNQNQDPLKKIKEKDHPKKSQYRDKHFLIRDQPPLFTQKHSPLTLFTKVISITPL